MTELQHATHSYTFAELLRRICKYNVIIIFQIEMDVPRQMVH